MQNLWLIPAFPFLGFLINGIFGRKFPKPLINLIAVLSVVLSFAWVMKVFMTAGDLAAAPVVERYFTWMKSGQFQVGWDFSVDKLTMIMLMVVTGVGSLIHIYATGYMAHEEGYYRFFAYLNLFMFFMLNLVLAGNYLILFVGWEGVGLCSYLLVGFYFLKKSATNAGNKAFIVNRIGDFGFSLAMFLIVVNFGTLDFTQVFAAAPGKPTGTLTAICLLFLLGACGKSAQIPLYVWLPDAMEGPTPVSALIHAATMVTAGVYMCTRSAVLFMHAPAAMETVAIIGLATAVFAATIGLTQYDIKKVYAYSTVSQLGYMFLGVGVGAFSAGIWHLMTHAFFKALLFLGAGSVIHACHGDQDMRNMGGLWKYAKGTGITLMCASLAISGFPFTAGYFSKDAILGAAYAHEPWMYWVGVITAGMTAFYVWRAWFMTFTGEYKGHAHPHESPWSMLGPLVVLAFLSLFGGLFFNVPKILEGMFPIAEGEEKIWLTVVSVLFGLGGIGLSYYMYVVNKKVPESIAASLGGFYTLVYNKYFIDEVYDATVVNPLITGSTTVLWHGVDQGGIDGIVNGVGKEAKSIGGVLRLLQSGNIRSYATWVVIGAVALLIVLGVSAYAAPGVGGSNLLDLLIAIPAIGFVLTLLIPRTQEQGIRIFTLAVSILTFVLSLGLATGYQMGQAGQQFVTDTIWIANPEIHWHVGVDGLSVWLIILSTFLTPFAILVSWRSIKDRSKEFFAFLLLLEFGLVGVFAAWDLFLFYVFWEVVLVPMYFLIGIWGHDRRIYAAVKFFLYTFAGSVLMLVSIIFIYNRAGTFDYAAILSGLASGRIMLTHGEETLMFLAFFLAFAIKVPMFPVHTWLPDAHVEAPTAGSLMLASVMLKMGTYGLVRFCLPMFPTAARENAPWIVILAIIGIVYGALVAMVQPNMKKVVAYSSVSHLGFVVLGIFSFTQMGLDGAVYQMLNHGISTGALFILVGIMYERRHSLEIADYGGVATAAPWLSTVFMITMLASIGLPTLNNFVGEFLVLQGTAQSNFTWTVFAAIGVILSACYMLWMYQRVFFGELKEEVKHHMPDLNAREWACAIPLIAMMVWMGIWTQTFLPAVSEANLRVLDQSKSNAPLRVSLPGTRGDSRVPSQPEPTRLSPHVPRVPEAMLMLASPAASFAPSGDDLLRFAPEIILSIAGTVLMVLDPLFAKKYPKLFGHLSIVALLAAAVGAAGAYSVQGSAFSNLLVVDGFATFFRFLVLAIGILTVLASYRYLDLEKAETGEYHALILLAIVGQCLMVSANDLIMIFIGLEISSIATYILAGYLRNDKRNNESALKYFLLGSFATAFLLYGIAIIFGVTGTTKLDEIRTALGTPGNIPAFGMVSISAALMFVGLAFKVSGAPFQVWTPDVYEGAPAPVSAFLATAPKAAAFAIFLRIFLTAFQPIASGWEPLIWISALLSMTIGNFAALMQDNLKRMLAYSSVANAGYILVALTARSEIGTAAAMFYLAAYALMTIGAFAVVIHLAGKGERHLKIGDLAGLGRTQPVTAALMTIFLLSLIGVPLTGGFFGKFYIFRAAIESNLIWLSALGLLNAAVAAYYYLRLMVIMYFNEPGEVATNLEPLTPGLRAALILPAIGTIVLGILPGVILNFAQRSNVFGAR